MNDHVGFKDDIQRYLDGDPVEGLDDRARDEADRLKQAIESYAARIQTPGPEVDRAVMAVVGSRKTPAQSRSFWRWFVQPHSLSVRPAFAAAAALVLMVLGATVVTLRPGTSPVVTTAEAETILVRFELIAPDAEQVAIAGSFNEWSPDGVTLTKNEDTGLWTGTVALQQGEHQYMFVIDGSRWIPDPSAHAQVDDGFGQENSVIIVGPRGVVRS